MLRLRNHLLPILRAVSPLPSPIHPRACLPSASASASPTPTPTPFFLEDYLLTACGPFPARARATSTKAFEDASKRLNKPLEEFSCSRPNSASNPDAIFALLSDFGLSHADISAIVAAEPRIVRSRVEKIRPRLLALRDRVGLSAPQIARLLLVGSRGHAIRSPNFVDNVEFLISFCGSFERALVVGSRSRYILEASLRRKIEPNLALLRQSGVRHIAEVCSLAPCMLTFQLERVKDLLQRAEELGVPPTSRKFKHAVHVVSGYSREKVAAKVEFLKKTVGCSESEVSIALSKVPTILGNSDDNLLPKIDFLINEVGMEPQCILKMPALLTLSLEKRLVPRHRVMKVLQAKGLLDSNKSFYTFALVGDEAFRLRFIKAHSDSVPDLAAYYDSAHAGDPSPDIQLSS